MDSRDLLRRLRATTPGDPSGDLLWREFVRRCRAIIRVAVWLRAGRQDLDQETGDIEQEVFRRLLAHNRVRINEFDPQRRESFETYVRRVADSVVVDWLRRRSAGPGRPMPLSPEVLEALEKAGRRVFGSESAIHPEHDVRMREAEESVRAFLDATMEDPRDRALSRRIYQLHFREGYSIQHIAQMRAVPLSASAISRRVIAVRRHLRKVLDPEPPS